MSENKGMTKPGWTRADLTSRRRQLRVRACFAGSHSCFAVGPHLFINS